MATIILLNGTSSSGKSSIARQIQQSSPLPYLHVKLDTFLRMIESRHLHAPKTMYSLIQGFHNSLEALARSGNYMVIDHVFQEMEWLSRCLIALKYHKVYFIGLHCDLEILKQRELDRGNRGIGIAEYQYNKVHANAIYDLSLDTGTNSPESNAKNILEYINETENPLAWKTLLAKNEIT